MSVEIKTSHPIFHEGFSFSFPADLLSKQMTDEKIKNFAKENKQLREEIKALKQIIKNIKN